MEPFDREGGAERTKSRPGSAGDTGTGRVIVIGPYLRTRRGDGDAQTESSVRDYEARIEEAAGLAGAIDLTVVESVIAPISQIRPATYLGKGKVEANGRVTHDAYLFEVKKPSESKGPWDFYKLVGTVPGNQAFTPLDKSTCALLKK